MTTTKYRCDVKSVHESITVVWRVFKKHLENPPQTDEDWRNVYHEFADCAGDDHFRSELAAACCHELVRLEKEGGQNG